MAELPPDIRNEIKVLEGDTFFISDDCGNMHDVGPYGLFYKDTRFLSRYWVEVNGKIPLVLTSKEVDYFSAALFLSNPALDGVPEHTISIVRHRFVGSGVHEDLIIQNHHHEPVQLQVGFHFDCDFADLFEVKAEHIEKKGALAHELDEQAQTLRYIYRRDGFTRKTIVSFTETPRLEKGQASFDLWLPAKGSWKTCIQIAIQTEEEQPHPKFQCNAFELGESELKPSLEQWRWTVPHLESDCDAIKHTYGRSYTDLAALRLRARVGNRDYHLPAAGLPWFMASFGRDTLITSYQTLLFGPALAIGALRALAARQGTKLDDFRDEEPRKILHEIRFGELATFREKPHSPYYGTADATPLFLILLSEVYRWTGDGVTRKKAGAFDIGDWWYKPAVDKQEVRPKA